MLEKDYDGSPEEIATEKISKKMEEQPISSVGRILGNAFKKTVLLCLDPHLWAECPRNERLVKLPSDLFVTIA